MTSPAASPGELLLVRHGETAWSRAGRHTGRTDIPLTAAGEDQARATGAALAGRTFGLALVSPLGRARRTAELIGHGDARVEPDLAEWDYGPVEGLTRGQVRENLGRPWSVLPGGVRLPLTISGTQDLPPELRRGDAGPGELVEEVAARAARVIALVEPTLQDGQDVLLVAHGHLLRIFTTVWLELHADVAERLALGTAARSVLGYDRGTRALVHWNVLPDADADAPGAPA